MTRVDRKNRRRAGFTIIEMMVALTTGAIAITSIYYVSAASSRHFHDQQRVAQAQMSLRMGVEQLRRDVARAGFMGTPNATREQQCVAPPAPIVAIQVTDGGSTGALLNSVANNSEGDTLTLVGNYVTSDGYLARADGTGTSLLLQTNWQGFRRSFSQDLSGTFSTTAFDDVFIDNRWMHIRTQSGNHFFGRITGRNSGAASVQITPGIPVQNTTCGAAPGEGRFVAPITMVQYSLIRTSALASLATVVSASPVAGVNDAALVRRELDLATGVAIPGTERVVLEHVAEFDVDVWTDASPGPATPPNLQYQDDGNATAATLPGAVAPLGPHRVRSAVIRVAVHTPGEDPQLTHVTRGANGALTTFDLDTTAVGAARVRSETIEVLLPNLVAAGML